MRIAYNPITAAALTTAPANNDITFDLRGLNIFVRGVKFKGTDTTYSVFKKHTSSSGGGYNGLVPVPSYTSTNTRFLREDGSWVVPTNTDNKVTLDNTTTSNFRPIILGYNNSTDPNDLSTSITLLVYTTTSIYAQPSTGSLWANKIYSNGFFKNGSSDNQVLLGGGGSKNLSDFALSSHTHPYLPLSGGTLTINTFYGLTIKRSDVNGSAILFSNSNGALMGIGVTGTKEFRISLNNATDGGVFKVTSAGVAYAGGKELSKVGHTHSWSSITSKPTGGSTSLAIYMNAGTPTAIDWRIGNNNIGEHNANNINYNFCGYYTSNGPTTSLGASTNDGAIYALAYSTSWVGQIALDYRNGNLFVRGKNNGTWQSWKKVWNSGDFNPDDFSSSDHTHYWANIKVSSTSNAATSPTFANTYITGTNRVYASTSDITHQLNLMCEATYAKIQSNGSIPLAINPDGNNVGIGITNPSYTLHVDGTLGVVGKLYTTLAGSTRNLLIVPGGEYTTTASSIKGYLKITLPVSWNATMMRFDVFIYNYTTNEIYLYSIGGYNYTSGNWVNTSAYSNRYQLLSGGNLTVRFGHDGSKCCVYIGESTTTWEYPLVVIRNVLLGFNGGTKSEWSGTWNISFTTELADNIDTVVENPAINYRSNKADTLTTARTINGTNFNGSANITTAYWGTARTLTIGNSAKSVNGSGNISWSLSEIGAAASSHTHPYLPLTGGTLTGPLTYNEDATLKIYNLTNTTYGGESVVIQTCFDGKDPETSDYVTSMSNRCNLILQPRGGQVYIGYNLTSTGNTNYKLYVGGKIYSTSGFVKASSSDSYLLLGGGGHKAVSDFMLKSEEITNNVITITKSLDVSTSWMDTGIAGDDLATGTYILLLYINDDKSFYSTYHSGVISWYADNTNDSETDEIILHRAGHAYHKTVYLRTVLTSSRNGGMKLLIAASSDIGARIEYKFKFKRII